MAAIVPIPQKSEDLNENLSCFKKEDRVACVRNVPKLALFPASLEGQKVKHFSVTQAHTTSIQKAHSSQTLNQSLRKTQVTAEDWVELNSTLFSIQTSESKKLKGEAVLKIQTKNILVEN